MPAKKRRSVKKKFNIRKILFIAVFFLTGIFFTSLINDAKEKKASIVYADKNAVYVTTIDFSKKQMFTIAIPGNTQVKVADNLGEWKWSAVWELGENEGKTGDLLRRTVVKNFALPAAYWIGEKGSGLVGKSTKNVFTSLFSVYPSNLRLTQKIRIALLSLSVKNTNRQTLNLQETSYLQRKDFVDGSQGYIVTNKIPERLYIVFEDKEFSKIKTIMLHNATKGTSSQEILSAITQMLGNKVVLAKDENDDDFNCKIYVENKVTARTLAKVLGCDLFAGKEGGFELEIYIGNDFL